MSTHKCPECGAVHERNTMSTANPRIIPRSRWTRTKSNAPAARSGSLVGVALHYPGSRGTIGTESEAQTAARLEGYRRQHVNGNGWKDIAYNVAVDQRGNVWTLRGGSKQSGANGTTSANRSRGASLLLIGNSESPSRAMIDGELYAARLWAVRYPGIRHIAPHAKFVSAAFPGSKARALRTDRSAFYIGTARQRSPKLKCPPPRPALETTPGPSSCGRVLAMNTDTHTTDDMAASPSRFYTLKEAAAILNVNPSTLSRQCAAGTFPHVKIGRVVRIPVAEVDRLERGEPARSSVIDVPDYVTDTPSMFATMDEDR